MNSPESAIEELRKAMVEANRERLCELTADELSYGHSSGLVENKKEFIDAIVGNNKRDVFHSIVLAEQSIGVTNGTIAIVRHHFTANVAIYGELHHPDIRVMQVWVCEEGKWKLLARQAYKT